MARWLCSLILATILGATAAADETVAPKPPNPKELSALWTDLADADAARAYRALCRLANHPGLSVPFLRTRLRPVPPLDAKVIARLLDALDHDDFDEREKAQKELHQFGEPIRPIVQKELSGTPVPETKRRLETLLLRLDEEVLSAETLRLVRAVEALERMGSAEARLLLQELAVGAPGARLTREARSSLSRMMARP